MNPQQPNNQELSTSPRPSPTPEPVQTPLQSSLVPPVAANGLIPPPATNEDDVSLAAQRVVEAEAPAHAVSLPPSIASHTPEQQINTPQRPSGLPPVTDETVPKKQKRKKLVTLFLGIVILTVLGTTGYFFYKHLQGEETPLSSTLTDMTPTLPLNSEVTLNTSYLYPEGWSLAPNSQVSRNGYTSSELDEENYPLATIIVIQGVQDPQYIDASATDYNTLRESYFERGASAHFEAENNSFELICRGQTQDFSELDSSANGLTGLTVVTTLKPCASGDRKSVKQTYIGSDGRMRSITIDAATSEWNKNGATFKKMLHSLSIRQ